MTYLPSLLKKIDEFYKLAAPPEAWTMPDEPEEESSEEDESEAVTVPHFDDLMNISHQVDDPGLAQQLRVLAELYRYAINMGGGYATIAKAITNLKNMYSDGSDSNIEFILNGMIKELSKQAGGVAALSGKDNPNFVQRLVQLKQDIEDRERSTQSGALDAYNEEVNAPGATEETAEELAESGLNPEEAEIVNPAALGFGDKDNPKTNKGWHTVGSGKPYKNWKEYYDAERASYEADFATETNPDIKNVLKELIDILPQLSGLTEATLKLTGELKVAPSEQGEAKKTQMLDALQKLKNKRQMLKNSIRFSTLQKDKQRLTEEMASARDPKVQMLLEQQIALKDLALSNDVYKAKERNYRQALVDSMSGGNFPGIQTYQDFLQKIDSAKKLRVSKQSYDAKQWAEQAAKEGRVPAKRPGQRGGWGEGAKQINLDKATQDPKYFPLLVGRVGPGINTAVAGTSYYIAREKEGGRVELKSFIEEVSKAIRKKDERAKFAAIRKLKEETAKYLLRKKSAISDYELTLRFLPFLRKTQSMLDAIVPWQKDGVWQLDDVKTKAIQDVVVYLARIQRAYMAHGHERKANFNSLINELFPKIQNYLEDNVLKQKYSIDQSQADDDFGPLEQKRVYDRIRTIEKAKEQGKNIMLSRPQRGGWGEFEKQNNYNQSIASFSGVVSILQEKINTALATIKQTLTRERFGGDAELKPFVDAVSTAIANGDTQAKYEAIKALKLKVADSVGRNEAVLKLEKAARLVPYFRGIKDRLKIVSKWLDQGDLNLEKEHYVEDLITKSDRLQQLYNQHYSRHGQLDLYFKKALESLAEATNRLRNLGENQ